jgi:hypothetical protein
MERKDTIKMYKLPVEVKFCRKCTVSNQRPRITFDENGVCSACNFAEYKKALALPAFDLSKTPQEEVISTSVDPLIEQARARITAISEAQATSDVRLLQLRQAQLAVENAIESGMIGESDGRRQINALLREQRDIQIAILEARRELATDPLELAQIGAQIESIRNMGVELTNAQRFMRGFGAAVEDVGDIFDRFGNNVARAFTSIKGLLGNLKNAVVQFFKDLLGNSLQRLVGGTLSALFGGLFGGAGGGGRGGIGGGGGGLGSTLGSCLAWRQMVWPVNSTPILSGLRWCPTPICWKSNTGLAAATAWGAIPSMARQTPSVRRPKGTCCLCWPGIVV